MHPDAPECTFEHTILRNEPTGTRVDPRRLAPTRAARVTAPQCTQMHPNAPECTRAGAFCKNEPTPEELG